MKRQLLAFSYLMLAGLFMSGMATAEEVSVIEESYTNYEELEGIYVGDNTLYEERQDGDAFGYRTGSTSSDGTYFFDIGVAEEGEIIETTITHGETAGSGQEVAILDESGEQIESKSLEHEPDQERFEFEVSEGEEIHEVYLDWSLDTNSNIEVYDITRREDALVSDGVTDEATNVTGDFALSSSAGLVTGLKAGGVSLSSLAIWEFSVRDWLFDTGDGDADIYETDLRVNAELLEDQRMNLLSSSELSQETAFGSAMAEAKLRGIESLQEEENDVPDAQSEVRDTVNDFYADMERVVVNGYNNEVLNVENDAEIAAEVDDIEFSDVFEREFDDVTVIDSEYTLSNGEVMDSYYIVDDSGARLTDIDRNTAGDGLVTDGGEDFDDAQYLNGNAHSEVLQNLRDSRGDAISNVNEIVEEIDYNYDVNEFEVTEELSSLAVLEGATTEFAETGNYAFASHTLAQNGIPTNLNQSFMITYNEEELEGSLHATEAVIGEEVKVNESYDGSKGIAQFVAQKDESAEIIELEDEFTVDSITSADTGSNLESTELQETETYTQETQNLQESINEIQSQLDATSTSITGGFLANGMSATAWALLVALIALAGAFIS